jgi:hypothetical protein
MGDGRDPAADINVPAPMTAAPAQVVRASLRVAGSDAERNAAIDDWLRGGAESGDRSIRRAVLAEGLLFDRPGPRGVPLIGLNAGCPCCVGVVALRVALGRTLRNVRPGAILLLTADASHLPRLRQWLERGELGVRFEVDG